MGSSCNVPHQSDTICDLQGKTPYEILYGVKPYYDHLCVVGCVCYIHNQDHHGNKFASRSRKCVFVGYPHGKKGWRVFDLEKGNLYVSHGVIFREDTFPYQKNDTQDTGLVDEHPSFQPQTCLDETLVSHPSLVEDTPATVIPATDTTTSSASSADDSSNDDE